MALTPGARLGPYEVTARIGAGGMGEVWRATDTTLGRQVAIKVLPDAFARDAERLARFEREAKTLAALNHSNIASIYGLQATSGALALVMELVEGPTLADRIARGPIPVDEVLTISRQIADALATAHEQGIVHRDLKPANVKVRDDGTVKVLDFGLAKALTADHASVAAADMANSPTLTSPMTAVGLILGTAGYMSPEQARGRAVDRRADIWAFGAVLFEMLSGRRAFPGEDVTDTLAAVVRAEPDWTSLPRNVPPTLLMFLRRCLEKDPRQRVSDIRDVRLALDGAFEVTAPSTRSISRTRERLAWAVALGAVSLAAAMLATVVFRNQTPASSRATRFSISPPDTWTVTTTLMSGGASPAPLAISPDGTRIVFVVNQENGPTRLWLRDLDALAWRELIGTTGAGSPFWSPDSRFVAFFADGKLRKIDVTGGPPSTLCDSPGNVGGTWNRDGVIVFGAGTISALQKVPSSGGVPVPASVLGPGENYHGRPSFLPDGRHFIYRVGNGPVYLTSLDSITERTVLLKNADSTNVVYSNGHLLFLRETTLMAQPFDAERLELGGDPIPIAEQVMVAGNNQNGFFSVSTTGVLIYQPGVAPGEGRQLTWFDRSGKTLGAVDQPALYNTVALSPDDTRVAVSRGSSQSTATNNTDVWVHEFARNASARLTTDPANDWLAVWSPDSSRIAWVRDRGTVYQKASSGAGADELLLKGNEITSLYDWSPDGRLLLYAASAGRPTLWTLPVAGSDRTPRPYVQEPGFGTTQARFSPDGRFVAYTSNASGVLEVYVRPFPEAETGKWMVSQGGGSQPQWRGDGKELFYVSRDSRLMAVSIATEPVFTASIPRTLFTAPIWGGGTPVNVTRYDVTSDGQRFLINALMDQEKPEPPRPITVVMNWTVDLRP